MQEELTISYSGFIHYRHFYYPFGMNFDGVNPSTTSKENRYQYNGMELEKDYGIDLSDYGARWYDAAIGRWTSEDPLADKYSSQSSYGFVGENPIANREVDGRYYIGNDGERVQFRQNRNGTIEVGRNASADLKHLVKAANSTGSKKVLGHIMDVSRNRTNLAIGVGIRLKFGLTITKN